MAKLYVLGGRQRKSLLKNPTQEWHWYEKAAILQVDTDSHAVRTCLEYETPGEARASDKANINFHAGALIGTTLYTCTATEVMAFELPSFKQVLYFSLPSFNDLHHVTPSSDGNLLVVNTGLDMIVKCSRQGEVLAEWSVVGEEPWARFSRSIDYRKVETTKPHASHPNFVFELDGEVWATRFHQRDAISLNGSGRRIDIAKEKPHDGILYGDRIYFTSVDGKIVFVNRHNLQLEQVVDLRSISDHDRQILPAWCRGLLPVDDRKVWAGFTRIRETQFKENLRWVKTVLQEGILVKPTHIALYDLVDRRCLQEFDLEPYGMNAVYGIFPVTDFSLSEASPR
jgi:hypothetical protein